MSHRILQASSVRRNIGYFALFLATFLVITPLVMEPAFGYSAGVPAGLAIAGGSAMGVRVLLWLVTRSRAESSLALALISVTLLAAVGFSSAGVSAHDPGNPHNHADDTEPPPQSDR